MSSTGILSSDLVTAITCLVTLERVRRTVLIMRRGLRAWLGEKGFEKLNLFSLEKRGLRGEFQGADRWGIVQHSGSRLIPSSICLRGDSRPRRPLEVPSNLLCVWKKIGMGTENNRYWMSLSCLYPLVWCYQRAEHSTSTNPSSWKHPEVSVILESAFPGRQFGIFSTHPSSPFSFERSTHSAMLWEPKCHTGSLQSAQTLLAFENLGIFPLVLDIGRAQMPKMKRGHGYFCY